MNFARIPWLVILCAYTIAAQAQPARQRLPSSAPVASIEDLRVLLSRLLATETGLASCPPQGINVDGLRTRLQPALERAGVKGMPSPAQVTQVLRTELPCPFSPYRAELRPATQLEMAGAWVFPQNSLKLRHPPRSRGQIAAARSPQVPRCEGWGFFPGGEARFLEAVVQGQCPFTRAKDFDEARRGPRDAEWSMPRTGRLVVQRTEPASPPDEWEVFTVTEPFTYGGVAYFIGDVVGWLRRDSPAELNAAVQFMHLRRLR